MGRIPKLAGAFAVLLVALAIPSAAPAATLVTTLLQPTSPADPQEVAFDDAGNAWVTGLGVSARQDAPVVFQVTPAGEVKAHRLGGVGRKAQGVVKGEDGAMYVCVPSDPPLNPTRPAGIWRVSAASAPVEFPLPSETGSRDGCWDLVAGPAGTNRIYYSGGRSETVGYVDTTQPPGTVQSNQFTVPAGSGESIRRPQGILVGPDGRIWFTLLDVHAVGRVSANLSAASYERFELGTRTRPRDIARWFDDASLWITESGTHTISRIDLSGVVIERHVIAPGVEPNRLVAAGDHLWFSTLNDRVGRMERSGNVAYYKLPDGSKPRGIAPTPGGIAIAGEGTGALYGLPFDLAPLVGAVTATGSDDGKAQVSLDLDARGAPTTFTVDFGPTTDYALARTLDGGTVDGPIRRTVSFEQLAPGTYHYRVRSSNAFGARATEDRTVVVPAPPVPAKPDSDRDGIPDDVDCDDVNPAVHQGLPEIPGNLVDEDCDGSAQPFRRVNAGIDYRFRPAGRRVRLVLLTVTSIPPHGSVRLTCKPPGKRKRACPFKRVQHRFRDGRKTLNLLPRLKKRALPAGTTLELRVLAPQQIGLVRRFRVTRNQDLKVVKLCLTPGAKKATACPLG